MTTVAVTGATTMLGQAVLEQLDAAPAVGRILGVDVSEPEMPVAKLELRAADVRDPLLAHALRDADVVVHLAATHGPDTDDDTAFAVNVHGTRHVLDAAAKVRTAKFVHVSSAAVYGAHPDNPVPLPENAPRVSDNSEGLMGDFAEVEELAERARRAHPGLSVTVVRPAPLVGPDLDTLLSRHFSAPRLLTVKGHEQRWQFCHEDDLASALAYCALHGVTGTDGVVAVASEGSLTQGEVEEIAGMKHFEVPANLAFGAVRRLHQARITPAAAGEIKFLVYPCVVDCSALRDAGWKPGHDNESALVALLDSKTGKHAIAGRRLGRKEVTITAAGAAGAAAAAIGTAAAIRHLRKRGKS